MSTPDTFAELVERLGTDAELAERLQVKSHVIRDWRIRDRIPSHWWVRVARMAQAMGHEGVTCDALAAIDESRAEGLGKLPDVAAA